MNISTPTTAPDINSSAFKANPFPFYAHLREHAPVYPVHAMLGQRAWLVTRYDDVSMVLKSDDFAKNPKNAMTPEQYKRSPQIPGLFKPLMHNLLYLDPPDHPRLRALVHRAFTPRLIEQMRQQTEDLTFRLLDRIRSRGGTFDLVKEFALPLPITLIGRILGVPEQDNGKFHRWTERFVTIGSSKAPLLLVPTLLRFMNYLRNLIKERARHPREDLISELVQAREQNDQLTEDEILSMIFILLSAGHETTVNLIASGTLALLQQPDQWTLLRQNPALIKTGIEELLRFVSPAETSTERYAKKDVQIAGTTIPKGELVLAAIASANRDASQFENPDLIDLARVDNKHLAFGQGIHYCVGAPLSRMEGQIAFPALIERLPKLRLAVAPEKLRWRGSFVLRGLKELPVTAD